MGIGQRAACSTRMRISRRTIVQENDAFASFWNLVSTSPRYATAMSYLPNDPQGFLDAINAAGYATDPNWSSNIASWRTTYQGRIITLSLATIDRPPTTTLVATKSTIERGMSSFIDVGNALSAIANEKLYQPDYKDFDEYCQKRWGFSKSTGYNYIKSAATAQRVQTNENTSPTPRHSRSRRFPARRSATRLCPVLKH